MAKPQSFMINTLFAFFFFFKKAATTQKINSYLYQNFLGCQDACGSNLHDAYVLFLTKGQILIYTNAPLRALKWVSMPFTLPRPSKVALA